MRSCIVLGCGRSETSMVAGALAKSGYFMGKRLHRPREANPKGFFESPQVNRINDALLRQVVPARPPVVGRWLCRERLGRHHMWLARVAVGTRIPCPGRLADKVRRLVQAKPYCFKDPRFSYTLGVWRPYIQDAVFVCVFRDPAVSAASIVKECRIPRYAGFPMDASIAFEIYTLMYRHILEIHRQTGNWLFLHYDQMLGGDGLDRLAAHVEAKVDRSFPERSLRRSVADETPPSAVLDVYQHLCGLAGYDRPDT